MEARDQKRPIMRSIFILGKAVAIESVRYFLLRESLALFRISDEALWHRELQASIEWFPPRGTSS